MLNFILDIAMFLPLDSCPKEEKENFLKIKEISWVWDSYQQTNLRRYFKNNVWTLSFYLEFQSVLMLIQDDEFV